MRILTLEEMELVAGGGGSRPKVKRAPKTKRTGSHSGASSGCVGGSHSGQGSSGGGGCGTPRPPRPPRNRR